MLCLPDLRLEGHVGRGGEGLGTWPAWKDSIGVGSDAMNSEISKCNIRDKTVSNWGDEFRDRTELWKCLTDCMQPSLLIFDVVFISFNHAILFFKIKIAARNPELHFWSAGGVAWIAFPEELINRMFIWGSNYGLSRKSLAEAREVCGVCKPTYI